MVSTDLVPHDGDGDGGSSHDHESYIALQEFPRHSGSESERHRLYDQALEPLRKLYAKGVPFFTKESIQDIVDQIDRGVSVISVNGLDGSKLDFPIRTGEIYPAPTGRHSEHFVMQVFSCYSSSTYEVMKINTNMAQRETTPIVSRVRVPGTRHHGIWITCNSFLSYYYRSFDRETRCRNPQTLGTVANLSLQPCRCGNPTPDGGVAGRRGLHPTQSEARIHQLSEQNAERSGFCMRASSCSSKFGAVRIGFNGPGSSLASASKAHSNNDRDSVLRTGYNSP